MIPAKPQSDVIAQHDEALSEAPMRPSREARWYRGWLKEMPATQPHPDEARRVARPSDCVQARLRLLS